MPPGRARRRRLADLPAFSSLVPGHLAPVAIKRILARLFDNLPLAVRQLYALACLPCESGRPGLEAYGHTNALDHVAMPPNSAIHDRSCHFGKSIGKFWQMAAAFRCFMPHIAFCTDEKKTAFSYKNRRKRLLYHNAFFVLGAGAGIENRSVNSANIQKYHHKYHHWRKSSSLPFHLERLLVTSNK